MTNLDLVYKDAIDLKDKQRLCEAFFSHTITSIAEVLRLFFFSKKQLYKRIEVRGIENLITAASRGRGVFLLSGHLGSWEYAWSLATLQTPEFKGKYHAVRQSLKTPYVQKMLFSRFNNCITIIHKGNAIRDIKKAIAKNSFVWIAIDQRAPEKSRSSCEIEFLGVKTTAYKTLASLAHRWQTPVVPCITYRTEKGRHIVEFHSELEWQDHPDKNTAIIENTRIYSKTIESFILQHPEQWIWSYNRWNKDFKNYA